MNFTESFDQFASRLTTMDLALYAGAGLILWVLFKDRLSPVQQLALDIINKFKNSTKKVSDSPVSVIVPEVKPVAVTKDNKEDTFFKLVVSWKQTRDLAVESDCAEAVKVADQMFPYLSPNVCGGGAKENV
jgi:hypothetical protein